jgi:hypothetical protein
MTHLNKHHCQGALCWTNPDQAQTMESSAGHAGNTQQICGINTRRTRNRKFTMAIGVSDVSSMPPIFLHSINFQP